jgi:glycosyltransferase involved in cell wall biosynthesis
MIRSLVSKDPFLIARDRSIEMRNAIRHTMQDERFDVIHADQLWMAPFALLAKQEAQKHGYTPILVLDQHNAVFQVPKRMAEQEHNPILHLILLREARLMAKYEVETCQKFDRVVWVTEEDRQAVWKQVSAVRYQVSDKNEERDRVIPICIDPGLIEPVELREERQEILFLGGMHWPPNADGISWFAREVLPLVKKECPEAKLIVVGKQPPEDLRKIKGVTITGYIDDPERYWKSCRVFIVPLKAGGGMRVKILDAWGHGIPVVSTTIGAEGIRYEEGKELLIADDPAGLAKAVVSLLRDTRLARQIGSAGRAALEREYDWRKIYRAWDEIYAN